MPLDLFLFDRKCQRTEPYSLQVSLQVYSEVMFIPGSHLRGTKVGQDAKTNKLAYAVRFTEASSLNRNYFEL